MEGIGCIWIDSKLDPPSSIARDDEEAGPTKPLGGKVSFGQPVEANEHISERRVQNPSSR